MSAPTIWQPAYAMTLLHVFLHDGQVRHETFPVLGLREVVSDGNHFTEAVVCVDGNVCSHHEATMHFLTGSTRLLVPTWPEEEDAARLAQIAEELAAHLQRPAREPSAN